MNGMVLLICKNRNCHEHKQIKGHCNANFSLVAFELLCLPC